MPNKTIRSMIPVKMFRMTPKKTLRPKAPFERSGFMFVSVSNLCFIFRNEVLLWFIRLWVFCSHSKAFSFVLAAFSFVKIRWRRLFIDCPRRLTNSPIFFSHFSALFPSGFFINSLFPFQVVTYQYNKKALP